MKTKVKTVAPDEVIARIQQAERDLAAARDELVDRGWINDWQFVSTRFILALEDMWLSIRDAVRTAEETGDGALMRLLRPVLDGATRLVQARRAIDGDRVNNNAAKFNRFIGVLDQLIPAIRRLNAPPRPPQIQSVREMKADGCALPAIMNCWRHLGVVAVERIATGQADDVPGTEHPEYVAWKAQQATMPDFNDSVLHGVCREIERARERGHAPAIV